MKLITKKIATNELFRERVRHLLRVRIHATTFRSRNPNSVDQEDRVSDVEFLSVPRITKICDLDASEVQIEGNILIELTLQSQVHGVDAEETLLDTSAKTCRFTLVIAGHARTNAELTKSEIERLTIEVRHFSTT
ncbi:MAG: hypothetical protein HY298_00680 [Verrucomicrobia bacterium]|nr:hypothetical protein [Verrucomicrobiota bacterium]